MDKQPQTKRSRISKAQRITLAEVLGASLILGVCIVVANFLIQYIQFNAYVIGEKTKAIEQYDQTIRNVGICEDTNKDGRLNDAELAKCRPNETALGSVPNSLRYSVYNTMAKNKDLELVARKRDQKECYDDDGVAWNFTEIYNRATSELEREEALKGMKTCSSLRVISDALPDRKNTEALMASLNQLFILAEVEPENISPSDDYSSTGLTGVGVIPVSMRMEGTDKEVLTVLEKIDLSIREFDIKTSTIEWNTIGLGLRANANAYYLDETFDPETRRSIRAKDVESEKKQAAAAAAAEKEKK